MRQVLALTVMVSISLAQLGLGQGMAPPAQSRQADSSVRGLSLDYRIGAGDTIDIEVVGIAELRQTLRIPSSGEINFHPVGAINVENLTSEEAEDKIASVLEQRGLIRKAQVLIYIQEYEAKRIYVTGEFLHPGEFVMSQHLTVMDAVLLAGGLNPFADGHAYLHRITEGERRNEPPSPEVIKQPDTPREGTEVFTIDLEPLKDGRVPAPDMTLRQGDYLIVPRRQVDFYFVLGEVNLPLNYILPTGKKFMVSQAIAGAGGPTKTAKISQGILQRYDQQGNRQEMKMDFGAILTGKQPDIEVRPNDVIFIPGSTIKEISEGFLWAANAMIAGTAFRVGRRYQLPDRGGNAVEIPPERER